MSTVWSLSNVDVNEFLKLIDSCKGNIYLITEEGDKLNLKSKLCQLIGLSKLIEGGIVNGASLVCDSIDDESVLVRYKLYKTIDSNVEAKAAVETEANDQ